MNDDRDHLLAPLLCPFRLPTSICNVATHTYFEHLQHTHLLNMPEHIMWFLYIRMRMIWSPITLPMSVARCSSPSSFSFSRPSSFSSSSIWLIGMRMIWSPITPPMSVAPRGSRVWQPPAAWIMYCSFNHLTVSNRVYMGQAFLTECSFHHLAKSNNIHTFSAKAKPCNVRMY